jgi:hypothetical protein
VDTPQKAKFKLEHCTGKGEAGYGILASEDLRAKENYLLDALNPFPSSLVTQFFFDRHILSLEILLHP